MAIDETDVNIFENKTYAPKITILVCLEKGKVNPVDLRKVYVLWLCKLTSVVPVQYYLVR